MIKPFGQYILIEPSEESNEVPSEFVDTEKTSDVPVSGIVIDGNLFEVQVGIGDRVWFKMWAGEDIKYKDKQYKLVLAKDIIAYEDRT